MEVGVARYLKGHMSLMIGSGIATTTTCEAVDDLHFPLIMISIQWIMDDHLTTIKARPLLEVKVHRSMTLQ